MSSSNLLSLFKSARRVSTPLVAITTSDPAATISQIVSSFTGPPPPVLKWDIVRGMGGVNDLGFSVASEIAGPEPAMTTGNPVECLTAACRLPEGSILFFHNSHRFIENDAVVQAIWNLRDPFKADRRMLVMLCPGVLLPAELGQDVLVLDEPLPDEDQLREIVSQTYLAAGLDDTVDELLAQAVGALSGLAAFPAEQATAMSLSRNGLDLSALWERKRQMIEQTPGLSVWRGGETFDEIGGVENAKAFLRRVLGGRDAPRAIVFLDEIEKALGSSQDTSGVSQSLLGTLLSWMQDNRATGIIAVGPPGSAKSMIAKAAGAEAGIPTIQFDLSGLKASLVGESEQRLRNALKIVQAVSQGRTLFIATCNALSVIPPELRRRFSFGTFFFDLPDADERAAIWSLYQEKFSLNDMPLPNDEGWTGAEIRQACELSWRLDCTLEEASAYIVPVSKSAREQIEKLRNEANGRFISASYPAVYSNVRRDVTRRAIQTEEI